MKNKITDAGFRMIGQEPGHADEVKPKIKTVNHPYFPSHTRQCLAGGIFSFFSYFRPYNPFHHENSARKNR